jgi:hypothetical protein
VFDRCGVGDVTYLHGHFSQHHFRLRGVISGKNDLADNRPFRRRRRLRKSHAGLQKQQA